MADWLVYWKMFGDEDEPWPVDGWRIKSGSRLVDVKKGDHLWLIVSGENCNGIVSNAVPAAGYLAEIFTVDRRVVDDDGWYRYLIEGREDACIDIDPPLNVDSELRALSKKPNKHVGMRCQTPRVMEPLTVDAMKKRLKQQHPREHEQLFGA
jgi:hypothetical protein